MGFERATIQYLLQSKGKGISLTNILTIGRQGMHLTPEDLASVLSANGQSLPPEKVRELLEAQQGFCEPFLNWLGAGSVDSMDFSPYEAATVLHDMNQPLPDSLKKRFSLVVDGGSLEHIFHYPTALRNCMEAVAIGGHFITVTPANNLFGHGFYQISPELLFRCLSPANGFAMVDMLLFEHPFTSTWYEVMDPETVRSRVELVNTKPAYLIACARRVQDAAIFAQTPQQSDYSTIWKENEGKTVTVADMSAKPPRAWRRLVPPELVRYFRLLRPFRARLYKPRP